MLAAGSLKALNLMSERPEMFFELRELCQLMHDAFDGLEGLELCGDPISPIKHLRVAESRRKSREDDRKLLKQIVAAVNHGR
jgi:serine palmitoyltransferase